MQKHEYPAMAAVEETHWWFTGRRRFIEVYLAGLHRKKLRIADLGAGTGGTTAWLSRYGTVVGVEPSSRGRILARTRGIRLRNATAEHTGLPSRSVDAVTLLDVLYHRGVNEQKALAEAFRILKPGGAVLVTDCAFAWLRGHHHRAVHGARRYTLGGMNRLLSGAGFRVKRASYTFFLLFPLILFSRVAEGIVGGNKWWNPKLFSVLCALEAALLRHVAFPWGASVIVLARK